MQTCHRTDESMIYSYSFDSNDKIIPSPKIIRHMCTSNCIFDGTCESLKQLSETYGNKCYVLTLCYTNFNFDIKSDDPIRANDTQIGCITSTITNDAMHNNDPCIVINNACRAKIGNFHFNKTNIMHESNSNYVISANVVDIVKPRDLGFFRRENSSSPPQFTRQNNSRSPQQFMRDPNSPRNFSSTYNTKSSSSIASLSCAVSPSSTSRLSGAANPSLAKSKATGIIYGNIQDMHKFLCEHVGFRPHKNRIDIPKINIIPINILINFIDNIKKRHDVDIWILLRINKWVKDDEPIESDELIKDDELIKNNKLIKLIKIK